MSGEPRHAPAADPPPRLHVLVGTAEAADPAARRTARRLLEGLGAGVAIQLRARLPTRESYRLAVELVGAASAVGGWCVVNGRPDVALAARAQAVQLGRTAIAVLDVRRWFDGLARRGAGAEEPAAEGGTPRIGASVHGVEAARRAAADGADYLVVGTIHETPSHPGRGGAGPGRIGRVWDALSREARGALPVLAIGGIDVGRVRAVRAAGAHGIVVRRAVWSAADPVAAARALHAELMERP